jgi:hypothetical protein
MMLKYNICRHPFIFKLFEPFVSRLTQDVITASFTQHIVGFRICFPYFETEFNSNSLLLYWPHTERDTSTQSQNWL